jgi:hypothetical protein
MASLASKATCCAVDIGLSASLVLLTLPSPTSLLIKSILPEPSKLCPSIVFSGRLVCIDAVSSSPVFVPL